MTLEELFRGRGVDIPAAQQRMKQLMSTEGLPYGPRTMTYNSRLAQELAAWADEQNPGSEIHNELFQAYFVNNVNLALPDALIKVAEKAGLDQGSAAEVIESRSHQQAVDQDWERSRQMGITGVPTFVMGERGMVGAQPFEQLVALVESQGVGRRS